MESNADQLILRILERLAAKPGYSSTVSADEFHLFEELEASRFIVGQIGPDTHDAPPTMVEEVKLTATGRQHMRELKQLSIRHAPDSIEIPVANSVLIRFGITITRIANGLPPGRFTAASKSRASCLQGRN
jgi:hypothetical protein